MKQYYWLTVLLFWVSTVAQTPGEWTWMAGDINSDLPSYGTQGVPSTNNHPGNSYEAAHWTDLQGNFWLYGGSEGGGGMGYRSDLWRFSPTTAEWTWMKGPGIPDVPESLGVQGVSSPLNNPGKADIGNCVTWVDQQGNLWLLSRNAAPITVLWKYTIATNEWTWMAGNIPANYGTLGVPSAINNPDWFAESPLSWSDAAGDFWFFDAWNGGVMWKFSPATNQWAWMSGDVEVPQQQAADISFGAKGAYTLQNQPGGLWAYAHWNLDYRFYMFGQFDANNGDNYAIMWCFDPLLNQWAWVGGDTTEGAQTSYGDYCRFEESNISSYSWETLSTWKSNCGHLLAYQANAGFLWAYDPVINSFSILDGTVTSEAAEYGMLGISSDLVDPGAVYGGPSWQDSNGHLWMIGGFTLNSFNSAMMRYVIDYSCLGDLSASASPQQVCVGDTVFCQPNDATFVNYHWDFGVINSDTDTSNLVAPYFVYAQPGTYTVQLIAGGGQSLCNAAAVDTATLQIQVSYPPAVTVDPQQSTICLGDTLEITASGANTYTWLPQNGLLDASGGTAFVSPGSNQQYVVSGTENGCSDTASAYIAVNPLPMLMGDTAFTCEDIPVSVSVSGASTFSWSPSLGLSSTTGATVFANPGVTSTYTVTGVDAITQCSNTALVIVTVDNAFCGCTDASALNYSDIALIDDGSCLYNKPFIEVPNVFTPNTDGANSLFYIKTANTTSIDLTIINRWGEEVFKGSGINPAWDGTINGKLANEGVYFFNYTIEGVNGEIYTGHGFVQLVR